MKSVSLSELKANPSRYLRWVQRGSEVQILVRGKPVARLVGLCGAGPSATKARRERLVRAGILRPGKGTAKRWLEKRPLEVSDADLRGALHDDRGDRL